MADSNPDMLAVSSDYVAMQPYWGLNSDILGGVEAMRARGKNYLPQFPNENEANYKYRLENSRFTNIYRDIVENLASKPFTNEVSLANDAAPAEIDLIVEDVDRAGNHLHVFAQDVFFHGLTAAIDWIFVDHTRTPEGATLADERRIGARPFWVRVPAQDMLAVYSDMIGGKEEFVYARMKETRVERDGHGEVISVRVRVLVRDPVLDEDGNITGYSPARYEVWKPNEVELKGQKATEWALEEVGPISIGVISLVPFVTGRRISGTWQINPPMRDVANLQVEHYQQETNLKSAKELTAFPMFKGDGISPPLDNQGKQIPVPVGPSAVLFAPMNTEGAHGAWGVLEISATSLKFLSEEIDKTERQMRELGRQPLVAGTAGITQIAAALASQKASSAIQAWAFLLKDALERAFVFTAMWLNTTFEPTVYVNTDFAIELGAEKAPEALLTLWEKNGISLRTLRDEYKRRGILSPEFNNEEEDDRINAEVPGEDEEDMRAAMTPPEQVDDAA